MLKCLLGNCKIKRVLGQLPVVTDVSLMLLVWALCVYEAPVCLSCMLVMLVWPGGFVFGRLRKYFGIAFLGKGDLCPETLGVLTLYTLLSPPQPLPGQALSPEGCCMVATTLWDNPGGDFPFAHLCVLLWHGARSPRCFACMCAAGDGQTRVDRAGAWCPTTVGVGMENHQGGGGQWAGVSCTLGYRQELCEVPALAGLGKREGGITSDAE